MRRRLRTAQRRSRRRRFPNIIRCATLVVTRRQRPPKQLRLQRLVAKRLQHRLPLLRNFAQALYSRGRLHRQPPSFDVARSPAGLITQLPLQPCPLAAAMRAWLGREQPQLAKVTITFNDSGFCAVANASVICASANRCVTSSAELSTPRSTSDNAWRVSSGPHE